ncbi:hypothetical protein FRB99_007540 [Tulasnella sp. 403]|nr:hypothetical protein FRB99_007540 [Tulasnella sp. 403]
MWSSSSSSARSRNQPSETSSAPATYHPSRPSNRALPSCAPVGSPSSFAAFLHEPSIPSSSADLLPWTSDEHDRDNLPPHPPRRSISADSVTVSGARIPRISTTSSSSPAPGAQGPGDSTRLSASAVALMPPPRRSVSYEDSTQQTTSRHSLSSGPISDSTSRVSQSSKPPPRPPRRITPPTSNNVPQQPVLASSSSNSPTVASCRYTPSTAPNTTSSLAFAPRSPMPETPSATSVAGSRRSSAATGTGISSSRRSSSAAKSSNQPSTYVGSSTTLTESPRLEMRRVPSKPALPSSSLGSSFGILSSSVSTTGEDSILVGSPDTSFLRAGGASSSRANRGIGGDSPWSPDTPLSTLAGGKSLPPSQDPYTLRTTEEVDTDYQTRTRPRQPSTASSKQQPRSHRSRAMTQDSTASSSVPSRSASGPTFSHSPRDHFPSDYAIANDANPRSRNNTAPSPLPSSLSHADIPIVDISPVSPRDPDEFGMGRMSLSSPTPPPPRAMTPASAIAYAYQLRASNQLAASPTPSRSPSYQNISSSSDGGHRSHTTHSRSRTRTATDETSNNGSTKVKSSPMPLSPSIGKVVAIGSRGDSDIDMSSPTQPTSTPNSAKHKSSSGALRGLSRKVSGKFSTSSKKSRRPATDNSAASSGYASEIYDAIALSNALEAGSIGGGASDVGDSDVGVSFEAGERGRSAALGNGAASGSRGRWTGEPSAQRSDHHRPETTSFEKSYHASNAPAVAASPQPVAQEQPRPRKLKSKSLLRLSSRAALTDPPPVPVPDSGGNLPLTPSTPGSGGGDKGNPGGVGNSIWRLVKKFSSSTLREKHRSPTTDSEFIPPVPPLPATATRSTTSSMGVGDSRRSSRMELHQPPLPHKSGSQPAPAPQRSPHHHKRSLSQSRATTTTALSSSPMSSDLSSSRYFFARSQSPRTSTSSYIEVQEFPPPLPKQPQQHIVPPDELYAAMLRDYGDGLESGGADDDEAGSASYHYTGRRSMASSTANGQSGSKTPSQGGLSAPPSRRRSTDRSRSREPPASRKSPDRDPSPGMPSRPSTSHSVSSMNAASKPSRKGNKSTHTLPSLPLLRGSDNTAGSNVFAARYVAVQGGADTPPQTASIAPQRASLHGSGDTTAKPASSKKSMFGRLGRSKSEVQIPPVVDLPPTLPPPATEQATKSPINLPHMDSPKSPESPTKRWSVDEKRNSAGSKESYPGLAPSSPTRAASFDSPSSRPLSLSTTVAFRELSGKTIIRRTEDEKARIWDKLMEKSERAGGTLHAKIESSLY